MPIVAGTSSLAQRPLDFTTPHGNYVPMVSHRHYDIKAALAALNVPFKHDDYLNNFEVNCPFCSDKERSGLVSEMSGNYLCSECGRRATFIIFLRTFLNDKLQTVAARIKPFYIKKRKLW